MLPQSIKQFQNLRKEGKITSESLTKEYFARIRRSELNEYIYPLQLEEKALEQAKASDERFKKGKLLGMMDGVPMCIKDCFTLLGSKTTNASKILENFDSPFDAETVARLRKAGAVFIGKGNTDQFTMGASTETSYFGTSKNPHNPKKSPGGSSGGVTASIAGDTSLCGLGTDTGGSIRQPAALCGIAGLKCTYGRNSRYGALSMASSFDTIGPLAKNCEDLAIILSTIAGFDPKDATTSHNEDTDYSIDHNFNLKGLKIGVPKEYFEEGLDLEIRSKIEEVIKWYKDQGAIIKDISLPSTKYGIAVYYILCPSEVSSNMSRYDGIRFGYRTKEFEGLFDMYTKTRGEGLGKEVKRRIMLGTYALSAGYYDAYYNKASKVRRLVQIEFEKAFEDVDVIITPSTPTVAFDIGSKANNLLEMYLCDVYTVPVNSAGIPGLNVPCGLNKDNLPIGFQLIGPNFSEKLLLNVGASYERR